jgi:hypothetical protein
MKRLPLAVAAAAMLLAAVTSPALADSTPTPSPSATATPAPSAAPSSDRYAPASNAALCSFGDNFYEFVSNYAYDQGYYNGLIVGSDALLKLNIDADGSWFCQVGNEWMDKTGNNLCLTWNFNAQHNDVITCQGLASQKWQLIDNDGTDPLGLNFGGLQSLYTNHGTVYLANNSTTGSTLIPTFCCWTESDVYGFTLDGPIR